MVKHIKTIPIFITVLISCMKLLQASELDSDIRYRTIIYFYPSTIAEEISEVKTYFKNFKMVEELPKIARKPVLSYKLITDIKNSFPIPEISYLAYFGRGLNKEQVTQIQDSQIAVLIDIAYPKRESFINLKISTNSLYFFSSSNNGVIWDSETRELYTPEAWKEKRIDSWIGSTPNVEDHTVIHAYKNDDWVRAISLGMTKFGLPDIVVNDFSWSSNRAMGNLINLVAQSITEGIIPNKENILEININNLMDTKYKKELLATLLNNSEKTVNIKTGEAKWEKGDPDNYLLEILFQNEKGKSLNEKQENLLSRLFGSEDKISYIKHNRLILEASERAKTKLPKLKIDFNMGLDPGEFIQVKTPFKTPEGGNEWMWVEILSWKDGVIKGLLKNEPYHIPNLKGGSEVVVKEEDVFDYFRTYPDGTTDGNETGRLILEYKK